MDNFNNKVPNKWSLLGWIFFLPAAFSIQALGILLLSSLFIGVGLNNQVFLDSIGGFLGTFLFIFFAGYFVPSKKLGTTEVIFWISISLSILSLSLGFFGVYTYVKMETPHMIGPIMQILGALYAVTLFPRLTSQNATLDRLWSSIAGLGGGVTAIGGMILIVGLAVGLIFKNWTAFSVGVIVGVIGILTYLYPWIHLYFRVRNMEKFINDKFKKAQ